MKRAYKKLKPGGKINIVVGDISAEIKVKDSLEKAGFRDIKLRTLSRREARRTKHMGFYAERPEAHRSTGLIQITAIK